MKNGPLPIGETTRCQSRNAGNFRDTTRYDTICCYARGCTPSNEEGVGSLWGLRLTTISPQKFFKIYMGNPRIALLLTLTAVVLITLCLPKVRLGGSTRHMPDFVAGR